MASEFDELYDEHILFFPPRLPDGPSGRNRLLVKGTLKTYYDQLANKFVAWLDYLLANPSIRAQMTWTYGPNYVDTYGESVAASTIQNRTYSITDDGVVWITPVMSSVLIIGKSQNAQFQNMRGVVYTQQMLTDSDWRWQITTGPTNGLAVNTSALQELRARILTLPSKLGKAGTEAILR